MSGRLRVLQLITSLAGGAGLYAVELARGLDRGRFEVELAFGPGYPLDEDVQREGLPHHVLGWTRAAGPASTLSGSVDLWRLLRDGRYDIVHAHCSLAGAVGRPLARLARVPAVAFTVHAFAGHAGQPAWRRNLLTRVERTLDRFTDRYFVTTDTFRRELLARRIAASGKIDMIPLGIEPGPAPDAGSRARARLVLGIDGSRPVVAAAGRFEPQKGFGDLIDAFAAVVAAHPDALLVLFGDGPLRPAFERQVARLSLANHVRLAGWRPDVPALLPAADLYCLSSRWESFGYVLLEAMAAGVPIVATRVDGVPEVLDGGRLGELVDSASPRRIADGLCALLADPARRQALALAGRAEVVGRYARSRVLAMHAQAYEGMAQAARSSALAGTVAP